MSVVGRSCANTIKRSRQNVAIATQVLSPSAIGGSLRGQRRLKHFGPPDDDEEEFISYRRRAAWKKMGYYGIAIVITILILMGTVLAVGYFQTKNKNISTSDSDMISSRSIKLVQNGKPFSYIYTSKTTPQPPSAESTDSQQFSPTSHSLFLSYPKGESEERVASIQNDDIYFPSASGESESSPSTSAGGGDDDYLVGYNLDSDKSYLVDDESNDSGTKENAIKDNHHHQSHHRVDSHSFHSDQEDEDCDDNQEEVISIDEMAMIANGKVDNNDKNHLETGSKSNDNVDSDIIIKDTTALEKESVQDEVSTNNENWKSEGIVVFDSAIIPEALDKEKNGDALSTTEEKATTSPQDSVISLEIPIYSSSNNNNNKTSEEFIDNDFKEKSDPIEERHVVSTLDIHKNETKTSVQDIISKERKIDVDDDDDNDNYEISENGKYNKSELFDNAHFHHQPSLFHTTLFNLDEDHNKDTKENKPVSTAIIIEDHDTEDIPSTVKKSQQGNDQILTVRQYGARNHNVKIMKNDKVMTLKATYTPERLKQGRVGNRLRQPVAAGKLEEISVSSSTDRKHKLSKDGGGTRNKTRSEWKLRLKVNREEEQKTNLEKDASLDGIKIFQHPDGTSPPIEQVENLDKKFAESEKTGKLSQEKPRSLSTSSSFLPSFESFLKAIMSNVQPIIPKKVNSNTNNNVVFKEHHLPQSSSPLQFSTNNNYVNNLDHFLPASTIASPTLELDPAHLRKRTFNSDHDIFDYPSPIQAASPPQPDNYFDHLLGQFPTVGTIGSPSPTGASSSFLNNFPSSSIYPTLPSIPSTSPYDVSPSGTNDSPQLAPGVVPLDLASSFIQVGGLTKSSHSVGQQQQQQNRPQATQYGAHAFYDSFGDFSSFPILTAQSKANSNNGNLPLGIGTLTTAAGQPPTYNSISQGIHLLNLISGTLPGTYYQDNLYASQSTPSKFQTDAFTASSSPFQYSDSQSSSNLATTSTNNIPTGQPYDFSGNLASVINSYGNLLPPPAQPSFSSPSFDYNPQPNTNRINNHAGSGQQEQEQSTTYDLPSIVRALALKTDREAVTKFLEEEDADAEEPDQVPAASSFSQSILTTLRKPTKPKKNKKVHQQEETTTAGSIVTLMTKPRIRTTSMFRENTKPPRQNPNSSPKSFSFEILPQRNNYQNPSPSNPAFFDENNVLSLTNEDMYPPFDDDVSTSRSKKKSSATTTSMDKPWNWKTFADPDSPDPRNIADIVNKDDDETSSRKSSSLYSRKMYEKKIRKNANNAAAAGLKSGFFT